MQAYELTLNEITDEVEPSPIGLWNHNIVTRTGALTRYSEERVRLALLPRGEATVSEDGIEFGGCFYTCKEALQRGWFVAARKRRFKVAVSYDGRLVDAIYVHGTEKQGKHGDVYACTLAPHSEKFKGLSFAEVKAYQHLRVLMTPAIAQGRIQARADYHGAAKSIIENAQRELKAAGPKKSRTSRKAAIRDDRLVELRQERQEAAALPSLEQASEQHQAARPVAANPTSSAIPTTGKIVSLQAKRAAASASALDTATPATSEGPAPAPESASTTTPISLAEKARLMRERMRHG